jgi:hypothetical protein
MLGKPVHAVRLKRTRLGIPSAQDRRRREYAHLRNDKR